MKKTVLTLLIIWVTQFSFAQTATNFTANDCSGSAHTLFTELDAGKVIVLCWVMPCASCIGPASTAATTVQGYASSAPGRVKFYMADDYGTTPCNTLTAWANQYSITTDAIFMSTAIKMSDYGGAGMPKTVVLGGSNHNFFYNQNNSVDTSQIKAAINTALAATTGIAEPMDDFSAISLYPNPANNASIISFKSEKSSVVNTEIFNQVGQKVSTVNTGTLPAGDNKIQLNTAKLNNGIYFVKISDANRSSVLKLVVSH